MLNGMFDIAIILVIAAVLGTVAKALKQPLIIAYLFTGIAIGYFGLLSLGDQESIQFFSSIGVTLLLFLVGLEMEHSSLKKIGKVSLAIGMGQVIFTFIFGYLISSFIFGFSALHSAYLAIALTFSSTVIIVKILSDKNAINSLYGRISIGLLIVQDFVVILILMLLVGIQAGEGVSLLPIIYTVFQGIALFAVMMYLGEKVFPFIFDKISKSQELIFVFTLAWVFSLAVVMEKIGFSIEVAGFMGGLALANSSQKYHIASKVRPLRDFFILAFFALLGSLIAVSNFSGLLFPIIILSAFVLLGNPFIVFIIMSMMGYKKRTSFFTGLTVAQISEFSLILATIGLALGHITNNIFAIIAAVGVITITLSTYMIVYADKIFERISPLIPTLRKENAGPEKLSISDKRSKPVLVIGGHRTGKGILSRLSKEDVMVIDFDPVVVSEMKKKGVSSLFADITDPDLFDHIDLSDTKVIISTSPNISDNLLIIEKLKGRNIDIILRAETEDDAKELYGKGADYVLLPNFSSGQFIGSVINPQVSNGKLKQLREKDILSIKNLK